MKIKSINKRPKYNKKKNKDNNKILFFFIFILGVFFFLSYRLVLYFLYSSASSSNLKLKVPVLNSSIFKIPKSDIPPKEEKITNKKDELWNGPVLYYKEGSEPINFILVEKSLQKLHLYKFASGRYDLIKTYTCATGKNHGQKQEKDDKKTPEGIYFNTKLFRDTKITVFGDKAFQLSYPDTFDKLDGNGGSGIFIHGTNQALDPYSTKGCVAMKNNDLTEIDNNILFYKTPIIIGENLTYKFNLDSKITNELITFIQKAIIPDNYINKSLDFKSLVVLGFKEKVVVFANIKIKDEYNEIDSISRLYLARPEDKLLVMIKREWFEKNKIEKIELAKKTIIEKTSQDPLQNNLDTNTILSFVEKWRYNWERRKIDDYMNNYHPQFVSDGKNKEAWKKYKEALYDRYKSISIVFSNIVIKFRGENIRVYFNQLYTCDNFKEDGYKTLELKKIDGLWKIYREQYFLVKPQKWPSVNN